MYEINKRVDDIKNDLDVLTRLIFRMEEKESLLFADKSENDSIQTVKNHVSEDLGKIKTEL